MSDAAKIVKKKDHRNSRSTKRDLFTLTIDERSAGPRPTASPQWAPALSSLASTA
jgi:hypothetical protein